MRPKTSHPVTAAIAGAAPHSVRLGAFVVVAALSLTAAGPAMALSPPTAVSDQVWAEKDKPHIVSWASIFANDIHPGGAIALDSVTPPTHGTIDLSATGGTGFLYTPEPGYIGPDSMTYSTMYSASGEISNTATITILVTTAPPVSASDFYEIEADQPNTISAALGLLSNDSDPDGDVLSGELSLAPNHGSLSLQPDGSFSYTPALGYTGTDFFFYYAVDPSGGRGNETLVQLSVSKFVAAPFSLDFSSLVPPRPAGFSSKVLAYIGANGYKKGVTIELLIDDAPVGSAITDATGNVSIPFDYPATPGNHSMELTTGAGGLSAKHDFTVEPNLEPEVTGVTFTAPPSGIAGTEASLTATATGANGGTPGVKIKVYSDNYLTGLGVTDVNGVAVVDFFYPTSPGQRKITVIAGNKSMQAPVTVLPVPPPAVTSISFPVPAEGEAGASSSLIASITTSNGVLEDAPLNLYLDGSFVTTRSTNSLGKAGFPFAYPATPGTHTIEVKSGGQSSGPVELVVLVPVTTDVSSVAPPAAVAGKSGSIAIIITSSGTLQTGATFTLSIDGKPVSSGLTDLTGKANVSFTYPAMAGPHTIDIVSGNKSWQGGFTVLSTPVVAPASAVVTSVSLGVPAGKPGQTVYLIGKITSSTAAKAGATVIAYIDGKKAASKTTDATGTAKIAVKLPSLAGKHSIKVVAGSKSAAKTFILGKGVTAKLAKLTTIKRYKTETIKGSFGTKAGKITLKITDPKGKTVTKIVKLGSTGKFSYKYKVSSVKGTWTVRYSYNASTKYYGAKSYKLTFKVK